MRNISFLGVRTADAREKMRFVVMLLLHLTCVRSTTDLDSGKSLSRQKRLLVWREGINWVQLVVGIGVPNEVDKNSITWGAVFKSYYQLPNNSTYYTNPTIDIERRKRSSPTRWKLYSMIRHFAESLGIENGRSCLLRAICEVAATPFDEKTGLLSEILRVILTPSSTDEIIENHTDFEYRAAEKLGVDERGKCASFFPSCKNNVLTQYTKSLW